jgi:polyribonucleotide 5'-hydroxyl-kinase
MNNLNLTAIQTKILTPKKSECENVRIIKVEKYNECRIDVQEAQQILIELVSGKAEIFGRELLLGCEIKPLEQKFAILAFETSTVKIKADENYYQLYNSEETSMHTIINIAQVLDQQRELAQLQKELGPRVLVTGSRGCGKSTFSKILYNYSLRIGWTPILVDLSLEGTLLNPPGIIGATYQHMLIPVHS